MAKVSPTQRHYEVIIEDLDLDTTQKQILKSTWLDYFIHTDNSAWRGWNTYNICQVSVIIIGLLIPIVEKSRLNYNIFDLDLSVISVLSLLVAALTTLNRQFNFERKWRHYRKSAETMRNEGDDFFALSGHYEKYASHREGFRHFTSSVTSFKRLEVNQYVEHNKPKE